MPRHEDEDARDTIYHKPLMPGYEGYIPRTQSKYGRRYAVVTSEGLSEFERECHRNRAQMKKLRHRTAQPISTISEYSLGDRMKVHELNDGTVLGSVEYIGFSYLRSSTKATIASRWKPPGRKHQESARRYRLKIYRRYQVYPIPAKRHRISCRTETRTSTSN